MPRSVEGYFLFYLLDRCELSTRTGDVETLKGIVEAVDVGLVMARVVDFEGLSVDEGLKCVVRVGERREYMFDEGFGAHGGERLKCTQPIIWRGVKKAMFLKIHPLFYKNIYFFGFKVPFMDL